MSLNWKWENKCGEATLLQNDKEYTIGLYEGNAFLIMLSEWKEDGKDMWNMFSFWVDKQHMKNCLGLNKKEGYTSNQYEEGWQRITKFRFNKAKSRHWTDIIPALAQAFDNIDIELYREEE